MISKHPDYIISALGLPQLPDNENENSSCFLHYKFASIPKQRKKLLPLRETLMEYQQRLAKEHLAESKYKQHIKNITTLQKLQKEQTNQLLRQQRRTADCAAVNGQTMLIFDKRKIKDFNDDAF